MTFREFKKWANQKQQTKKVHEICGDLQISSTSFYYYLNQSKKNPEKFIPSKIISKIRGLK